MAEQEENFDSRLLFARLAGGDDQAADAIFRRYFAALYAFTRQRISQRLQGRFDADDVVNSAYRTFFAHARNQEFVIERSGDLWRLLIAIAHRKLLGQIEFHSAKKRDQRNESGEDAIAALPSDDSLAASVALEDSLERLLAGLSASERELVVLRLQGESTLGIAERLRISERSVRRKLQAIRAHFEDELLA